MDQLIDNIWIAVLLLGGSAVGSSLMFGMLYLLDRLLPEKGVSHAGKSHGPEQATEEQRTR